MLVLTRKINQAIIISGNIRVQVLGLTKRGHVKIGVSAPLEVIVLREELLSRLAADPGADKKDQR